MPRLIEKPTVIEAAGNMPKRIEEYAGRVNSGHAGVSVARMVSPEGCQEPGQRPEFEEITVVLRGMLRVEHEGGSLDVRAGHRIEEWNPSEGGIATALPRAHALGYESPRPTGSRGGISPGTPPAPPPPLPVEGEGDGRRDRDEGPGRRGETPRFVFRACFPLAFRPPTWPGKNCHSTPRS